MNKKESVLKIKDDRWNEFVERASEFGFKLDEYNYYYFISFYEMIEHPRDTFELQIWIENKHITIETHNSRYGGFSTSGYEFIPIFNLIKEGFIEKSLDNEIKE